MSSDSLDSVEMSPVVSPRRALDGIDRTTSSMSVHSTHSKRIPIEKSSSNLHTERASISNGSINKLQAQGTKQGVGYTSATASVGMAVYFYENKVDPLLIWGYWIILFLILLVSFIEPILQEIFKKNDRLSSKCEEIIIIKLRDLLALLIIAQTSIISYIFSHPMPPS